MSKTISSTHIAEFDDYLLYGHEPRHPHKKDEYEQERATRKHSKSVEKR